MQLNYEFLASKNVDSVIVNLREYGVAIIPNYLSSNVISKLNTEFHKALYQESSAVYSNMQHPTNVEGRAARLALRDRRAVIEFSTISEVFNDQFMKDVADSYYSPASYSFNESVFITNEFPSETQILPWHFDRVQSLKFWVNLTDTTKRNGAMEYCPGSHWEGRYRAGFHLSQGVGVEDIPNDLEECLIRNPVTLELNAGDLMIFDADGFHRGGVVEKGGERRVLRAHTYPVGRRYGDKLFSAGWWLSSCFNLNKWTGNASKRILGAKIEDNTINRKKNNI